VKSWHDALSLHKATLKSLTLNNTNAFNIRYVFDLWPSFTSFTALKKLEIEYQRMIYEQLPPNLTYLYLFDCQYICGDFEIDAWLGIKSYCPNISLVEIMTTQDCRSICRTCKYRGMKWGNWLEYRQSYKGGFELNVWFNEVSDPVDLSETRSLQAP
jgi:hypothetical protein